MFDRKKPPSFAEILDMIGGLNVWGPVLIIIVLALAGTAKGQALPITTPGKAVQAALEMQLYGCIADERANWSVRGTGMPRRRTSKTSPCATVSMRRP